MTDAAFTAYVKLDKALAVEVKKTIKEIREQLRTSNKLSGPRGRLSGPMGRERHRIPGQPDHG